MVNVKAHKNPTFAIISEKYLEDMHGYLEKNNVKKVIGQIESVLSKLKEAQEGKAVPRQRTDYQEFSRKVYSKVKEELKNETGEEPQFKDISSRIGVLWKKEKEAKGMNV